MGNDVQECTFLQPERPSTFMKRLQSIAKTNWRTDPSVQDVIIAQFFKCLPPNVVSMINLTDKLDDLDNIARLADCAIEQTVTCNSQTRPNDFDNFKNVITAQMQELCTQVSNLQMQHPAQSLQNVPTSNVRPLHRLPSSR